MGVAASLVEVQNDLMQMTFNDWLLFTVCVGFVSSRLKLVPIIWRKQITYLGAARRAPIIQIFTSYPKKVEISF